MKYTNCEICSFNNYKLLFVTKDYNLGLDGNFNIVKCQKCGLVYLNPRPDDEELKKYYPVTYYERVVNKIEEENLNERYEFISYFKHTGKILDVGCGNGLFLNFMKEKGWEVYGVEVSKMACNFAKEKFNLEVYNSDLINADLKGGSFDLITMYDVLEHIPNINENLKRVYELLKTDGVFIANVPNFNSLQRITFGKYWCHLDIPRHFYHFTSLTLKKILENNNFISTGMYKSLIGLIKNPLRGYVNRLKKIIFSKSEKTTIRIYKDTSSKNIIYRMQFKLLISTFIRLLSYMVGKTGSICVVAKKNEKNIQ